MKKYQNTVIAVDLYEEYHPFLTRALHFAREHSDNITLVHAVPYVTHSAPYAVNIQESVQEDSEKRFKELKTFVNDSKINFKMLMGSPKHEICAFAKEHDADLLIVGSHGKHGIDLLIGSTANGIIHLAHCDVLTIRIDYDGKPLNDHEHYKKVMLATDLAHDSELVVNTAVEISKEHKGSLQVINVVPDAAMLSIAYIPNLEVEIQNSAKERMKQLKEKLKLTDEQAEVSIGQPKHEILEAVKKHKSDLIVIGSHGHSALSSLLLGSTANAVLHGAQTDVLIVRIHSEK